MLFLHALLSTLADLIQFGIALALTWFAVCMLVEFLLRLNDGTVVGTCVWVFLWVALFSWHEAYVEPPFTPLPLSYMGMQ